MQIGNQYDNEKRNNLQQHKDQCAGLTELEIFDIDSYLPDHGLPNILSVIARYSDKYNIICSSLGPKLSAISLYKAYGAFPNIALTYVPTKEYSFTYSKGIKKSIKNTF
ncbi:hypothetical protein [Spirosoma spitsbergense]|uniref:hypothetical protein n=1 Tax=Spirosoma spitsbergense TaxID=431554 RepID=UPI0012F90A99|nr:hypothetical protein [Spirosoma spitsbergense]